MPTKPTSQMQEILDAHKAMGPLPIETLSPELARLIPLPDRAAVAVYGQHFSKKALAPMPLPVGKVEHKLIPGGEGDVMARIYTPKGDAPKGGFPVTVYFHGGGWVIATLDTYDSSCRALCDAAKTIVVSVHYRQAPEYKWPAAIEDCYAAYNWVQQNCFELKGNPSKIAIAGESAGGNLATVTCLMLRDKGGQMPIHQLLVYPVTDLAEGENSPSANENADAKPLNKPMLTWFYNHYLPEGVDRKNPMISPLYADVNGLPPATIILAEIDPLRSDGVAYYDKLQAAGVPANIKLFKGVTHEFFGLAGLVGEASDAIKLAATDLKTAFDHIDEEPKQAASF